MIDFEAVNFDAHDASAKRKDGGDRYSVELPDTAEKLLIWRQLKILDLLRWGI